MYDDSKIDGIEAHVSDPAGKSSLGDVKSKSKQSSTPNAASARASALLRVRTSLLSGLRSHAIAEPLPVKKEAGQGLFSPLQSPRSSNSSTAHTERVGLAVELGSSRHEEMNGIPFLASTVQVIQFHFSIGDRVHSSDEQTEGGWHADWTDYGGM